MHDPQEPSREEQPKVKTILIVEDDPAIGELFALVVYAMVYLAHPHIKCACLLW